MQALSVRGVKYCVLSGGYARIKLEVNFRESDHALANIDVSTYVLIKGDPVFYCLYLALLF